MIGASELRLQCNAAPEDVKRLRHALTSFLDVFLLDQSFMEDISLAVGEVLANAVEHSCPQNERAEVELIAQSADKASLAVTVYDHGHFIKRERREGRGFGLNIVRAIAHDVSIETDRGTRVRMVFTGP